MDALARELGVPRQLLEEQDPETLARQVGAFMRLSVEGLHALLKARASSRGYMRAGRGTMVQQTGNNPLKFMPTAEDALRVLLGPPSRSYLGLEETLGESFKDLGAHQMALYAAMQKAVRRMMEDLEPASIERRAKEEGGLGLSRKARLWEIYKERYNARAEPHDDGMVDVFLMYFSEAYEEALGRN
jgi:type VI secretion system protein ImpI